MTKLARKNVGAVPIANRKYVWGETRGQTPHTIAAKLFDLGFFCPNFCDLSNFENLKRFLSFTVYPALASQPNCNTQGQRQGRNLIGYLMRGKECWAGLLAGLVGQEPGQVATHTVGRDERQR